MQKRQDVPKGGYQNLIQDYHAQLNRTRAQNQANEESKESIVSPSLFDEAQEKTKRNFSRMKAELLESIDTIELKFASQFHQLSEIREVVELERKALEDLYQIRIPSDSLAALASLKKERIAGMEIEFEKKKKDFEDECRRRKIELDLSQKTLEEHQKGFEKHVKEREQKSEDALSKKRIELSKLEQSIEEKHRLFTQNYEEMQKKLEQEFAQRQRDLDAEINQRQLNLGKIESDLQNKETILQKELEAARLKAEEVAVMRRIEWAKEEEAYQLKKMALEDEIIQSKKKLEDEIQTREKQFWDSLAQEKQKWKQDESMWEKKCHEQEETFKAGMAKFQTDLSSQYEAKFIQIKQKFERDLEIKNKEIEALKSQYIEPSPIRVGSEHKIVRPIKSSFSGKASI